MSNNLFVTATELRSGESVICLGLMELLFRKVEKVGFFRPVISEPEKGEKDNHINLIATHFNLKTPYESMYAYTIDQAEKLISQGRQSELIDGIVKKYNKIMEEHDFVLCQGVSNEGPSASFEFDFNAEVSDNLGCPVLLVANARNRSVNDIVRTVSMYEESFQKRGCSVVATMVNRADPEDESAIKTGLESEGLTKKQLLYVLPNDETLGNPTIREIAKLIDAKVLYGKDYLDQHVYGYAVAAMQLRNFLGRVKHGSLIITPGDRLDVIFGCLAAAMSINMPYISGILLTGGLIPGELVHKMFQGYKKIIPILSVKADTFPATRIIDKLRVGIKPEDSRKITQALCFFEKTINTKELGSKIIEIKTKIITPKMFEFQLLRTAGKHKQHVVLPEGEEERILRATEELLSRDIVDITLLGKKLKIKEKVTRMGLNIENAVIIDPLDSELLNDYAQTYFEMRKDKGITLEMAHDIMSDVSYFGTMMVYKGHSDGMVSGAVHTTGDTIRPAFQIIKTKPGGSIVSSVIFMCLKDRVLVYGDCAINPNPDAQQLAQIAISSAETAAVFDIEPRVAMLSYSTGESGKGIDVDIVRDATKIARKIALGKNSGLKLDGPIQYDAAVDMSVANTKMVKSEVAGRANVLIFPDLNTGNNTYKAVQRSSGAIAIGPVLQGLNKPVNDLSRGCLIPDIINTVAITAIQAQYEKGLL